jgi:hypothetical protein
MRRYAPGGWVHFWVFSNRRRVIVAGIALQKENAKIASTVRLAQIMAWAQTDVQLHQV